MELQVSISGQPFFVQIRTNDHGNFLSATVPSERLWWSKLSLDFVPGDTYRAGAFWRLLTGITEVAAFSRAKYLFGKPQDPGFTPSPREHLKSPEATSEMPTTQA
jgi:hypothetical protein